MINELIDSDSKYKNDYFDFIGPSSTQQDYIEYRFYLPSVIEDKFLQVKKFFCCHDSIYESKNIPHDLKLRDNVYSYMDFMVDYFYRLEQKVDEGIPISVGSMHLSPVGIFTVNSNRFAVNSFHNFQEIINYHSRIVIGDCRPVVLYFKYSSDSLNIIDYLAEKYNVTRSKIVVTIMSLSYDICKNSYVDCDDSYEYFINQKGQHSYFKDYDRDMVNFNSWKAVRKNVFGIKEGITTRIDCGYDDDFIYSCRIEEEKIHEVKKVNIKKIESNDLADQSMILDLLKEKPKQDIDQNTVIDSLKSDLKRTLMSQHDARTVNKILKICYDELDAPSIIL